MTGWPINQITPRVNELRSMASCSAIARRMTMRLTASSIYGGCGHDREGG